MYSQKNPAVAAKPAKDLPESSIMRAETVTNLYSNPYVSSGNNISGSNYTHAQDETVQKVSKIKSQ